MKYQQIGFLTSAGAASLSRSEAGDRVCTSMGETGVDKVSEGAAFALDEWIGLDPLPRFRWS